MLATGILKGGSSWRFWRPWRFISFYGDFAVVLLRRILLASQGQALYSVFSPSDALIVLAVCPFLNY